MELFSSSNINFDALRRKAFNFRWAEVEDGVIPLTAADPDFPAAPRSSAPSPITSLTATSPTPPSWACPS